MQYSEWVTASARIPNSDAAYLEDYGGRAYSKLFLGTNYQGLVISSNGDGTSTVTSTENVFDSNDEGMEFCAHKSHKRAGWPIGAKYGKVTTVVSPQEIIVDTEFSENGYFSCEIFYDNSSAWQAAAASGKEIIKLKESSDTALQRNYYYLLETPTIALSVTALRQIRSEGTRSTIKAHREDHLVTGDVNQATLFNVGSWGSSVDNFAIVNVDIVPPINTIKSTGIPRRNLFTGRRVGTNDPNTAPTIAVINCNSDKLYKELVAHNRYNGEMCMGFGWGTTNFSGREQADTLMAKPAYGYIYQENHTAKGLGFMTYNANWSGCGPLWVTKDCHFYTINQNEYATVIDNFEGRITNDKSDFTDFVKNKSYYPPAIESLTSTVAVWPVREAYSGRSAILQVQGSEGRNYVFHLGNDRTFSIYYPQIYGDSPTADNTIHETYTKRLMAAHIPKSGETYIMSREYSSGMMFEEFRPYYALTDNTKIIFQDYSVPSHQLLPSLRSQINWSTVFMTHGSEFTEEQLQQIAQTKNVFLQIGDIIEIDNVQYAVKQKMRGYHTWKYGSPQCDHTYGYKAFPENQIPSGFNKSKLDASAYECYVFDPPLPDLPQGSNPLVTVKIIKSHAEELLDGNTRQMSMAWKSQEQWKQTSATQVFPPANNVVAHGWYNQRELNEYHENSILDSYYRMNNMNYSQLGGLQFDITDPDTGQPIPVKAVQIYPWFGKQWIGGQRPYGQYVVYSPDYINVDKLLRSQGINLPETEVAKQRAINTDWDKQKDLPERFYTTTEQRPLPQQLLNYIASVR